MSDYYTIFLLQSSDKNSIFLEFSKHVYVLRVFPIKDIFLV